VRAQDARKRVPPFNPNAKSGEKAAHGIALPKNDSFSRGEKVRMSVLK
jgi:hypothetical protein